MSQLTQGVSVFKPVVLAGITAISGLFSTAYVDEFNQVPTPVQVRGAFSTERREVPNVVVSYRPGAAVFQSGQNIAGLDAASGMYLYGFYLFDGSLRYTVQARNEAEREWLIDVLATGFTGLVFTDPSSGVSVNNAVVDYLGSQGIVAKGWDAIDYPAPVGSDAASPRPEGQVWEAVFPVKVDVSLSYLMPGVSAKGATLTNTIFAQTDPPLSQPWQPSPLVESPLFLSAP